MGTMGMRKTVCIRMARGMRVFPWLARWGALTPDASYNLLICRSVLIFQIPYSGHLWCTHVKSALC